MTYKSPVSINRDTLFSKEGQKKAKQKKPKIITTKKEDH